MAGDDRRPVAGFDVSKPNIARVYDAFLGGKDNFAADRELSRTGTSAPIQDNLLPADTTAWILSG